MTHLTRRIVLKLGAAGLMTPFLAREAGAAEFNYKLGLELREDEPLPKRMIEAVAAIEEESGGRLKIRPFPNGALGNPVETLNQVRSGALDMLTSSFGILSTLNKAYGLPTLGFVFGGYDQVWGAIDGALGQHLADKIEKGGEIVVINAVHDIGFRHVTSNIRVFADPGDLKGLRIRTPPTPFLISLFTALGAAPTPINFGDLYAALQTGTVDAQENPLTVVKAYNFQEVQKYCTLTGHTWDGWVPVANQRSWSRLPEDLREIVTRNFRDSAIKQRADIVAQTASVQAELEQLGMVFKTPDAGIYQKALEATSFYTDWAKEIGTETWAMLEHSIGKSLG